MILVYGFNYQQCFADERQNKVHKTLFFKLIRPEVAKNILSLLRKFYDSSINAINYV